MPTLAVTYNQLVEWIKQELVPKSDPASAAAAWRQLKYTGDADNYVLQLSKLMKRFPLKHKPLLDQALYPLGEDIQAALRRADAAFGRRGMPLQHLKSYLRDHLISLTSFQRKALVERVDLGTGYDNKSRARERSRGWEEGESEHKKGGQVKAASMTPLPEEDDGSSPRGAAELGGWMTPRNTYASQIPAGLPTPPSPAKSSTGNVKRFGNGDRRPEAVGRMAGKGRPMGRAGFRKEDRGKVVRQCWKCKSTSHWSGECAQKGPSGASAASHAAKAPAEVVMAAAEVCHSGERIEIDRVAPRPATDFSTGGVSKAIPDPTAVVPALAVAVGQWPKQWGEDKWFCEAVSSARKLSPLPCDPSMPQLFYPISVSGCAATALLDPGASHSFMRWSWARERSLPAKPLSLPLGMTTFNNQRAQITHSVEAPVEMKGLHKEWVFLLAEQTPATIVIGLDMLLAWPLFLNLLDRCLYLTSSVPPSSSTDARLIEEVFSDGEDSLLAEEGDRVETALTLAETALPTAEVDRSVRPAADERDPIDLSLTDLERGARPNPEEAYAWSVTASGSAEAEALAEFIHTASEGASGSGEKASGPLQAP